MHVFAEERAEAFRLALGCDLPTDRSDVGRIVEMLGPAVTLRRADIRAAALAIAGDGRGFVLLPRALTDRELDESALHEVTHYLLEHGAASWFRTTGDMDRKGDRARADLWEAKEELEVGEFVGAFFVPSALVRLERSDRRVAELTGCSADVVQRRRELLRGKATILSKPPEWSAWWRYEWAIHRSALCSRVAIHRRGEALPVYEVPLSGRPEEAADRVNGELVALTSREFGLKYDQCACEPPERGADSLDELRLRRR